MLVICTTRIHDKHMNSSGTPNEKHVTHGILTCTQAAEQKGTATHPCVKHHDSNAGQFCGNVAVFTQQFSWNKHPNERTQNCHEDCHNKTNQEHQSAPQRYQDHAGSDPDLLFRGGAGCNCTNDCSLGLLTKVSAKNHTRAKFHLSVSVKRGRTK